MSGLGLSVRLVVTVVLAVMCAGVTSTVAAAGAKTYKGRLVVVAVDHLDGRSELRYMLRTSDGRRVPLKLQDGAPSGRTGDVVRVRGTRAGGAIRVADGRRDVVTVRSAGRSNEKAKKRRVAFILLNFREGDEPLSRVRLSDLFHRGVNTAPDIPDLSVQAYYDEVSYGQVDFVSNIRDRDTADDDVFGWYTVDQESEWGPCDFGQWAFDAERRARRDGFRAADYEHVAFIFPDQRDCGFSGAAPVGGKDLYLNMLPNGNVTPATIIHELGHNLGLDHAEAISCRNGEVPVAIAENPACRRSSDLFDVMGPLAALTYRHTSVPAKARMGWLPGGSGLADATDGGTFRLTAVEESLDRNGPRGIKIRWAGPLDFLYYYVEFRTPRGYDRDPSAAACAAWLASSEARALFGFLQVEGPSVQPDPREEDRLMSAACFARITGTDVQIRVSGAPDGFVRGTFLLDATPETGFHTFASDPHVDAGLSVGRTFEDPYRGISITLDKVEPHPDDLDGPPMYATVTVKRFKPGTRAEIE